MLLVIAVAVDSSTLRAHFIDVDQGDSILLQLPEHAMLIDAGTRQAGEKVLRYISGLNIDKLDIVIGTHPHADHIGGLIQVIQQLPVKKVIDPAVPHTTRTFEIT